ncbi:Lrp/AsnC family transcriptional regulator [Pyrolobus fumarii]|uniref:Lrp/AsnC family transcriptional regulator n=1 Tax=Pyrolobus fumarii TaxID=54252 RepID=UPI000689667E|nr:Lrp/AsnC family transcriptional regulator [Pyrolobus fumarii]
MHIGLGEFERRALMLLQYEFPLDSLDPFEHVAVKLGVDTDHLLSALQRLAEQGILKRVGFYVNPRSRRKSVALVAFRGGNVDKAASLCASDDEVTHCYERDGGEWRVWVVRRARSIDELLSWAASFARNIGADGFEVLVARRVHRLSVKYDLYRGVSRAGPYTRVVLNPPSPEELGLPSELPALVRSLPLSRRPYASIAERLGLREEDVLQGVKLLLERGVLGDPGAVLDGHRIGFRYNAMVVAWPRTSTERLCEEIVDNIPEATHIVERLPYPSDTKAYWAPTCYAMVHGVSRDVIEPVIRRVEQLDSVDRVEVLYSVRDLKPGAER